MDRLALITRPSCLLPSSPQALAWLDNELDRRSGDDPLHLAEAWMLAALPHRREELLALAASGGLRVGEGWVRLDPYALAGPRPLNRALAEQAVAAFPGAEFCRVEQTFDTAAHLARAGLCLEQRALADRVLARALGKRALAPALLPALTGAGLGGCGTPATERSALEVLRGAGEAVGIEAQPSLALAENALPKRCRSLSLGDEPLTIEWSRARGLMWSSCSECDQLLSLEVQSDTGGRGAFVARGPSRPRVFEARHATPVHFGAGSSSLALARELRLPADPDRPDGRRAHSAFELTLAIDAGRIDVLVRLDDPVPGQRYRLWFPLPFHPRPSRVAVVAADGACRVEEREGPFAALPVMPPVALCGNGRELQLGGAGLREVELFARQNTWICAVTLLRAPAGEPAPRSVVRAFSAAWQPAIGSTDGGGA